jgi:hypothetical protein
MVIILNHSFFNPHSQAPNPPHRISSVTIASSLKISPHLLTCQTSSFSPPKSSSTGTLFPETLQLGISTGEINDSIEYEVK